MTILEGSLFLVYDMPPLSIIIYALTVLIIWSAFQHRSISVAGWWISIYMLCSFIVIPVFHFIPSRFTLGMGNISSSSFDDCAPICIWIMFVFFLAMSFMYRNSSGYVGGITQKRIYAPRVNMPLFFILAFSFSLLSQIIGIGKMGVENARLPFHLSGIIQFSRMTLFPVLGLCIYARKKNQGKKLTPFLVLFFIWALLEAMVRLSKSALLTSFLPMIIYELLCDARNFKQIAKKFAPIVLVVLVMYPIIETMRHSDNFRSAMVEAEEEEIVGTYLTPDSKNRIVKPFNRQFLSGYLLISDLRYINDKSLFDFSHAPYVLASGGSAVYQTFVLDGYPDGVAHSSGTSPFIDGFLLGGVGLLLIGVIIMVLLAHLLDVYIKRDTNYIMLSLLIMSFYSFFDGPLFTLLITPMGIRSLLVVICICLFIHMSWKSEQKFV